jgi:hypothetical protein
MQILEPHACMSDDEQKLCAVSKPVVALTPVTGRNRMSVCGNN